MITENRTDVERIMRYQLMERFYNRLWEDAEKLNIQLTVEEDPILRRTLDTSLIILRNLKPILEDPIEEIDSALSILTA